VEFRHLQYFKTVAEELHFGRAAEILKMSQPPLSKQIQQLESELGVQLFERSKRQVRLTDAGQVFLERVYQIFREVNEAVDQAKRTGNGQIGTITIGFIEVASYEVLPRILREYQTIYPEVEIKLRELTTIEQMVAIQKGEIDVGFARLPVEDSLIYKRTVWHEPFIVALPEHHSLSVNEKIHLSDLKKESFIFFPSHMLPSYYDEVINMCLKSGFTPKIVQEASHMQTTINLIASGIGLSIVPGSAALLQRKGVVYRELAGESNGFDVAVICKKDNTRSVLRNFISIVPSIS
jgi:DNA-binding transcriptional LysR family regulator